MVLLHASSPQISQKKTTRQKRGQEAVDADLSMPPRPSFQTPEDVEEGDGFRPWTATEQGDRGRMSPVMPNWPGTGHGLGWIPMNQARP